MPNLKRRFPVFSRALRLYPKAYYRKFAMQTMQTLADILDDAERNRRSKLWLHTLAWFDLGRSIIKQRVVSRVQKFSRHPVRTIRRNTIVSLLLAAPLLVMLSLSRFLSPTTSFAPSILYSRFVIDAWSIVMPLLATIVAVYTLSIWLIVRQTKWSKRSRASIAWLSLSVVLGAVGIGFSIFIGIGKYNSERQLRYAMVQSAAYQRQHPTLACTLLPAGDAQHAMGKVTVTLNNMPSTAHGAYDGILESSASNRVTGCSYIPKKFTDFGVAAYAHEAFTPAAQQKMHDAFFSDSNALAANTITLFGYDGFYMSDTQTFDLRLWVQNYWLEVNSSSFSQTSIAMTSMIKNLNHVLAVKEASRIEAAQRNIVPIPVTDDNLTSDDREQIGQLLVNRDLQPAGTEYHVNFTTIAGRRVNGSINYGNGVTGTFVADNSSNSWKIISYRSSK